MIFNRKYPSDLAFDVPMMFCARRFTSWSVKRFCLVVASLTAILTSPAMATRILQNYDLDSLRELSNLIVKVQLGASVPCTTPDGDGRVDTVKVLEVIKGSEKAGDTIRVDGLEPYSKIAKSPGHVEQFQDLGNGDVVYLFLKPNGETGYAMYARMKADFTVIESGVRFFDRGSVYSFGQGCVSGDESLWACGGFIQMTGAHFKNPVILTQQQFEQRLAQSRQSVDDIDELLAKKPSASSAEALKKALQSRQDAMARENAGDDVFYPKLLEATADSISPQEVLSLYEKNRSLSSGTELEWSLQRDGFRSYLLQRVADRTESHDRRLECANILATFGNTYAWDLANASAKREKTVDASFANQMAVVAANELGTDLVEPLLRGIADCTGSAASNDPDLLNDLRSAADRLAATFNKASVDDQFLIADTLMQISPRSYHLLPFFPGPMLTIVKPADSYRSAIENRALHLTVRFRNQLLVKSTLKIVLRRQGGGPTTELPAKTEVGNCTDSFGDAYDASAKIPAFISGPYDLFLRDYVGGTPNGDGLGFSVQIPK